MTALDLGADTPDIWLRSFFGFDPGEDGYIGWTKEAGRDLMIRQAAPGDLMLIYGADTTETAAEHRRQVLGFLMVDLVPIRDIDKASPAGLARKTAAGWKDRWIHALPVRRAWRVDRKIELRHLAPITYTPDQGRKIAAWSARLTPAEVEAVLQLPVTEVNVWGEPPVATGALVAEPLRAIWGPSRGVTPTFGVRQSAHVDGGQKLYMMRYGGDAAALLGRQAGSTYRKALVKIGYSNDVPRRVDELNVGIPPKAADRWKTWLLTATYPGGEAAKAAEDALKADLAARFESLGGEFFLGDETDMQTRFSLASITAKVTIRA